MVGKRHARMAYYSGLKDALVDHMTRTENGLRALQGVSEKQIEKMVAAVRKKHDKLMRQVKIDGKIVA